MRPFRRLTDPCERVVEVVALLGPRGRALVPDGEGGHHGEQLGDVHAGVGAEVLGDRGALDLEPPGGRALVGARQQRGDSVSRHLRGRGHVDALDRLPRGAFDLRQLRLLRGGDERDRLAAASGAPGAADAVHVRLGAARQVEVDDEPDALDVEAAGRDVGGDEHAQRAAAQPVDDLLALALRDVAGQVGRLQAARDELAADALGVLTGADEDDGAVGVARRQHADERAGLVALRHDGVRLAHGVDGRRGPRDRDADRVDEVLVGDAADAGRHRRGEQRHLAAGGDGLEDLVDVLGEAHLEHLVGLVEHQHAHPVEDQRAALEVVDDAPGRADDDLGAAGERPLLGQVGGATVDGDDGHAVQVPGERGQRLGHLQGELPGRRQDDGLHGRDRGVDVREQRQAEGGRLAGAGLRDADEVAPGEQRRDRVRLDGGGLGEAEVRDGAAHRLGQREVVERGRGQGRVQQGGHGNRSVRGERTRAKESPSRSHNPDTSAADGGHDLTNSRPEDLDPQGTATGGVYPRSSHVW